MVAKGIAVHYVHEDAAERGLGETGLVAGARAVRVSDLPKLFEGYDYVWLW